VITNTFEENDKMLNCESGKVPAVNEGRYLKKGTAVFHVRMKGNIICTLLWNELSNTIFQGHGKKNMVEMT